MKGWNTVQRIATQTLGLLIDPRGVGGLVEKIYAIGCTPNPNPAIENAALHVEVQNALANPVNVLFPQPITTNNTPQGVMLPVFRIETFQMVLPAGGALVSSPWMDIDTPTEYTMFINNTGLNAVSNKFDFVSVLPGGLGGTVAPGAGVLFPIAPGSTGVNNKLGDVTYFPEGTRTVLLCGSYKIMLGSVLGTTVTVTVFFRKRIT